MRGTILPCDWAEAIAGKLYAQGIGWSRIAASRPVNIGVGLLIHVDYNETNTRHHFVIRLEDEDGAAFPPHQPFQAEGDLEVGRPPGMRAGEQSIAVIAANINQITFPPGGYTWKMTINGEEVATYPFTAFERGPGQ